MLRLSSRVLMEIIKFLKVEEIYGLLTLSRGLISFLQEDLVMRQILSVYYPKQILEKIQQQDYFQCLKSLKGLQQKEIPFWGVETNAGLFDNNLRFWIGKSFMKTKSPQVALRKSESAFISGTLAKDQVEFKQALINYTKQFSNAFGKTTMININDDNEYEIEMEDQGIEIVIENIKIFDTFRSFYILQYYLDANNWDSLQYLQNYAQTKHIQILGMVNLDFYHLIDNFHERQNNFRQFSIQDKISFVQQLEIDRSTQFNQIIKTIFIFTSQWQYIQNTLINNCTTWQQLYQLIKSNEIYFVPTSSNIPIIVNEFHLEQSQVNQEDYLFCTFEPRDQVQPLVWLSIINQNLMNVRLQFNAPAQRLAKSISLKIFDTIHQEQQGVDAISFSYISVRGLILNQQTYALENQFLQ